MKLPSNIADIFSKVGVKENVSLAPFSTLKIGGPARYFAVPTTIDQIKVLQRIAIEYGLKLHILSGGSNTLFSDVGFDGLVIKLAKSFDYLTVNNDGSMTVGSATSFAKTTKAAIAQGWAHAVGWSGTPGLLGGAIRMNAGTRMGEIKDAIHSVRAIRNGELIEFTKDDIKFTYRNNNLPNDIIIFEAKLAYEKDLIEPVESLTAKVQEYRVKRRLTQPSDNSLGSFFKNPYPLFAAQLIEKCNLKGLQYNGAQISFLHANFIVNNGGATANDILSVAAIAKRSVFDNFGVLLQPEIRMVGEFSLAQHSLDDEKAIT